MTCPGLPQRQMCCCSECTTTPAQALVNCQRSHSVFVKSTANALSGIYKNLVALSTPGATSS